MLATCVGDFINSERIAELYKKRTNNRINPETINDYINAFIDSFIIYEAFRYDLKGKE